MARRADRPILEDLLAYAEEAAAFLEGRSGQSLGADRMRLMAVVRAVEIVGEAANQLSDECRAALPFDLRPAIGMRHRLIHGYDNVSADIVARTIRDDFPDMIVAVRGALATKLPGE